MLGIEYASRVVNFARLDRVFCKLYFKDSGILIVLSFEYAKVLMHQESKYAVFTKCSK